MIDEATIWRWTILESSGRWYRAVCRYVPEAAPPERLKLQTKPLIEAKDSSLDLQEAIQQVVLWELDSLPSSSISIEQLMQVQREVRRLAQLGPRLKQIVALRLDQAEQASMWYDTGANAVLTRFSSLPCLAKKMMAG